MSLLRNAVHVPPHTEEAPALDPVEAATAVVERAVQPAKAVVVSRRIPVEEDSLPAAVAVEM